jgi:hypothetical protein
MPSAAADRGDKPSASRSRLTPGIIDKGFGCFATLTLRRRLVDWQRSKFGRTKWQFKDRVYERPRVELVPFDDSARRRLEQSQPEGDGDREVGGELASQGWTAAEIASGLGTTRPWVLSRLAELREELAGLSG